MGEGEGGRSEVRGRKAAWGALRSPRGEAGGEEVARGSGRAGGRGGFKCRRVSTSLWDRTQDSPTLSASLSRIEARRSSTSSVLSLSTSLSPSPSRPSLHPKLHSSKPRTYIRIRTNALAGIERGRNPSFPRRRGRRKENGHADRRGDGERSRSKFAISFRWYLSLSLCLPIRTITRPFPYIRMRRAGRNLPLWKTTQRQRQSAFRRAIGPRRHSETQWKAQILHRLPVRGNESGKLPANRAGPLALPVSRRFPPSDPRRLHLSHSHIRMLETRRLVAITAELRLVARRAFPPFAKNGTDLDRSF